MECMTRNPAARSVAGETRHARSVRSIQIVMKNLVSRAPHGSRMYSSSALRKNLPGMIIAIGIAPCSFFIETARPRSVPADSAHTAGERPCRSPFVKKGEMASPFCKKMLLYAEEKSHSPRVSGWGKNVLILVAANRRYGKSMLCSPARPEGTRLHAQAGHRPGRRFRCAGQPCRQGLRC